MRPGAAFYFVGAALFLVTLAALVLALVVLVGNTPPTPLPPAPTTTPTVFNAQSTQHLR